MLRVVRVTPDWHGYDISGGGWPSAVPVKESEFLKYFEVAIWEETEAIHLYEFNNNFDPNLGLSPCRCRPIPQRTARSDSRTRPVRR